MVITWVCRNTLLLIGGQIIYVYLVVVVRLISGVDVNLRVGMSVIRPDRPVTVYAQEVFLDGSRCSQPFLMASLQVMGIDIEGCRVVVVLNVAGVQPDNAITGYPWFSLSMFFRGDLLDFSCCQIKP